MLPTLRDALCELDEFQLARISGIHIETGTGGYQIRAILNAFLPLDPGGVSELPVGVSVSGFQRWPDIELVCAWQTDIWDQILEAIRDPWLTVPDRLGTCEAVELIPANDNPDSGRRWDIVPHGAANSAERKEWAARVQ